MMPRELGHVKKKNHNMFITTADNGVALSSEC